MAEHVSRDVGTAKNVAPLPSIMATTFAPRPRKPGSRTPTIFPVLFPEYIRPLFCEGRKGPFRWVALRRETRNDIARTDALALELFPENANSGAVDEVGERAHSFPRIAGPAFVGSVMASAPSLASP